MTAGEFERRMRAIEDGHLHKPRPDFEAANSDADELIVMVLNQLGYHEGVEIFKRIARTG